jgi:hypothetical protein
MNQGSFRTRIYYKIGATGASRSLKGTADRSTQRVATGFADGKNTDLACGTGIYDLTQDEAPGLLHYGAPESQPFYLFGFNHPSNDDVRARSPSNTQLPSRNNHGK